MRKLVNNINWDEISEIDWARLAAYIDGEGCITISKAQGVKTKRVGNRPFQYMKVFIANTDPRLMEWCQRTFGGSVNGKKRVDRERHKPCYQWTVCSEQAWLVLLGCMQYFIIKRDQAEVALAFQRTMTRKRQWLTSDRMRVPNKTLDFRTRCYDELKRIKEERIPRSILPTEASITN